jgi:hypothetical protein
VILYPEAFIGGSACTDHRGIHCSGSRIDLKSYIQWNGYKSMRIYHCLGVEEYCMCNDDMFGCSDWPKLTARWVGLGWVLVIRTILPIE